MIDKIKSYVNLKKFKDVIEIPAAASVELFELARGEYNANYLFEHPISGKKLVFRLNTASQMHLSNQIGYEYNALKLLENSGRTPKALYVDGSLEHLDYGVLVMEFLPGRHLRYDTDMDKAANILADIHAVSVTEDCGLITPENPPAAMLDECESMAEIYYKSELCDMKIKKKIEAMLHKGKKLADSYRYCGVGNYKCIVNTELNSNNFLIEENTKTETGENLSRDCGYKADCLVDWEKPILGDPAQDIGHFLAPTTTFWKTDVILGKNEMNEFVRRYKKQTAGRFETYGIEERVNIFVPMNCLRGITWSAMAFVEYNRPDRPIKNEYTFNKICSYLKSEFLEVIDEEFLE